MYQIEYEIPICGPRRCNPYEILYDVMLAPKNIFCIFFCNLIDAGWGICILDADIQIIKIIGQMDKQLGSI